MSLRRFVSSVLPGAGESVNLNLLDIKNIIETNAPNFFSNIDVDEYLSDDNYVARLSFYDNNNKIALFRVLNLTGYGGGSSSGANDFTPNRCAFYTYNIGYTFNTFIDDDCYGYNPGVTNRPLAYDSPGNKAYIYEVIIINENCIALSVTSEQSGRIDICKSPGIIMFMKSHKGNIAILYPNNFLSCKKNSSLITSGSGYFTTLENYLCCQTHESQTGTPYFSNIPYSPVAGEKTILNPILVKGTNDFVPDAFYVPISQYILNNITDATFYVGDDQYYFNGFIAVKINNE